MPNKIVVIGSTNIDYVIKNVKLPAIGETVNDGLFIFNFGGKGANQALAAARAGGEVTFVTCLGKDLNSAQIIQDFNQEQVNTSHMFELEGEHTGIALVMLDDQGNNYLSVAPGANNLVFPKQVDAALEAIIAADYIMIQMEIPFETNRYVFEMARKYDKRVVFNFAPAKNADLTVLADTYLLIVNEIEAAMITGLPVMTNTEVAEAARKIREMGAKSVIITLGEKGGYVDSPQWVEFFESVKVQATDTTAAGDVFCGSLCVALAQDKSLKEAIRYATVAAALCVTRLGAQQSIPKKLEIEALLQQNRPI
jgi:ribokinase